MFINTSLHSRAGKKDCFISNKILVLKLVFLNLHRLFSRSERPYILNTGNTTVKLNFYVFLNKCGFSLRTFYHEFQLQLNISFCSSGISNSLFFQLFLKCRKLRRLLSYLKLNMHKTACRELFQFYSNTCMHFLIINSILATTKVFLINCSVDFVELLYFITYREIFRTIYLQFIQLIISEIALHIYNIYIHY